MEIVRRCCCGVDVHKKFIVATIATTDSAGITTYQQETFQTMPTDLTSFALWLEERECRSVCMESTGKYWIPLFDLLESRCMEVYLTYANINKIRTFRVKPAIAACPGQRKIRIFLGLQRTDPAKGGKRLPLHLSSCLQCL